MAHLTSHKAGGAFGVLRHDERDEEDKIHSRKNECIIPERTHLNYNLAPGRRSPHLMTHIETVCKDNGVRLNNRKDLNVMSSWIVTVPKDVPHSQYDKFFEETHKFLSARYGEKYVLSSTVHLDETTPHLHFCFIPVGIDKNGEKTVSSKLVCTRNELRIFHKELSDHLSSVLGHEVAIENGATKEGNQSIDELKRKSAIERIAEAHTQAAQIVQNAKNEVQAIKDRAEPLKAEYEAKKAIVSDLNNTISFLPPEAELKIKGIGKNKKEYITIPKDVWDKNWVSLSAKKEIAKAFEKLDNGIKNFKETATGQNLVQQEKKIEQLQNINYDMKKTINKLDKELLKEFNSNKEFYENLNEVLRQLPEEVSIRFVELWNEIKTPEHNKDYEIR